MFTEKQRKRVENIIEWAEAKANECRAQNRPGPLNHHLARASSLRAALAEIDRLRYELGKFLAAEQR